ncbi:HIT family protein [Halobacillus seohaensis]|uniref:HIT family protein n=1 Tax=Halobacillus seohaensis TaxID=447421 RepID=A0ABW2EP05_9BACI
MKSDFYCQEVLNGNTRVEKVYETENTLVYHHTRPSYEVHIVAIPKKHLDSLTKVRTVDQEIIFELMESVQNAAARVEADYGACRIITNLGEYQESSHLHWHIVSGEKIK